MITTGGQLMFRRVLTGVFLTIFALAFSFTMTAASAGAATQQHISSITPAPSYVIDPCTLAGPCIRFSRAETQDLVSNPINAKAGLASVICGAIAVPPGIAVCAALVNYNAAELTNKATAALREGKCAQFFANLMSPILSHAEITPCRE
jgi:hypothetical protein